MNKKPIIVLGVIGNDIHVVANRLLEMSLKSENIIVVNLGTNSMPLDFADTALECSADAVLIGSLNGEAIHWCTNLRDLFKERGIGDILIYLGGNLTTGDMPWDNIKRKFHGIGINRIYHGAIDIDIMIENLKKDVVYGCSFC
jgi:methylaspartate mutase sigma subunit